MAYPVGDLVAEFLIAAVVTTAFGIVSVHNWPTADGLLSSEESRKLLFE